MRILICHNYYQQRGGECEAVDRDISLLREAGHDVNTFTRHNDDLKGASGVVKGLLKSGYSTSERDRLSDVLDGEKPEVAHVHNVFPLLTSSVYDVLAANDVPIVQTIHNFRLSCLNGLFHRDGLVCRDCIQHESGWPGVIHRCHPKGLQGSVAFWWCRRGLIRESVLEKVTTFVVTNSFAGEWLQEIGVDHVRIAERPNFSPRPSPSPVPPSHDKYIVYMGRLSPEKGLKTLLAAAELLCESPVRIKIAGGGPMEDEVRRRLQNASLSNVELLGHVSGRDKEELLAGALTVLVPSECFEHFPLVVSESFSHGVPVVASNIGGLSRIVRNDHTGLLVPPGDPEGLAGAIQSLLDDPDSRTRLGRSARREYENSMTPSASLTRLEGIYQRAMA